MLAMMVDLEDDDDWAMADELEDDDFDRYDHVNLHRNTNPKKNKSFVLSVHLQRCSHKRYFIKVLKLSFIFYASLVMPWLGRALWTELPVVWEER